MNFMKRFVSGLGAQAAPFGFGVNDPDSQYRAGLSYIGDIGANMLANNQGGVDPFSNFGMSAQQAKEGALVRNRQAMAAQQMMQEAEENRLKREQEAQKKQEMETWINSLPPEQQGLARLFPEKIGGALVSEQFPDQGSGVKSYAPIPVDMGNGQVGYVIPREDGSVRPLELSDGAQFISPYDNAYQKRLGTEEGKAVGEARGDLPGAIKQAEMTKMKIDNLVADPNLESAIGWTSYLPDAVVPNGVINVRARIDELMGSAFLEARQLLKGGGQITDFEGQRAEKAYTRMERAIRSSNVQDFKDALADFRQAVEDGVSKLQQTARVPETPQAAPDPLQAARDAIARGADPAAVRQRLLDNGIDPSGL